MRSLKARGEQGGAPEELAVGLGVLGVMKLSGNVSHLVCAGTFASPAAGRAEGYNSGEDFPR